MSLPALIAAMLRPEFYAHRPARVELVQTHISYVLLADDQVYKVKKPVRFSFLDFSTLERRRHFCQEEIRLNRRLARDTYLTVVAIRAGDARAGFALTGEEDPEAVEYAVHMRRLPAERMLDKLLERNAVTAEMIDTVAERLADFHRHADSGTRVSAYGDPAAVGRVLEDNFAGVGRFRGVTVSAADDDAIQSFSRQFLQRHEALFRARQAAHRIRECHGDLHAEHVCFTDGLVIFDCIEFNQEFRCCDVASEIAFLAMDLEYHGHPELGERLVAGYVAHAGDAELRRLMPFYQCERAYVRGKVESLKSAEEEVAAEEREAARRSAWRHFALAYRYTWADAPCLVAVAGLSGTGKSVIAAALHARTGFTHISSDVVRKRLAGVPPTTHHAPGLYTPELSARTYDTMLAEAGQQLAAGHGVILDATFQLRVGRDAVRALARSHGVPLVFVECRCDEAEVRERLRRRAARGDSPSDADWNVYLEQRRRFEPFGTEESDRLVIETTQHADDPTAPIEAAMRKAVSSES